MGRISKESVENGLKANDLLLVGDYAQGQKIPGRTHITVKCTKCDTEFSSIDDKKILAKAAKEGNVSCKSCKKSAFIEKVQAKAIEINYTCLSNLDSIKNWNDCIDFKCNTCGTPINKNYRDFRNCGECKECKQDKSMRNLGIQTSSK